MPRKTTQSGWQQVSGMTSLHETKSSYFPPFTQLEYFLRFILLHYQQNKNNGLSRVPPGAHIEQEVGGLK